MAAAHQVLQLAPGSTAARGDALVGVGRRAHPAHAGGGAAAAEIGEVSAATTLVRYDAMRTAITAAHSIDEVKDIRDKALALQLYARQANDTGLERQVHDIRVRAERRTGELLREAPKAVGTRGAGRPPLGGREERPPKSIQTLADLGLSKDQSSQFQKLAAVPEDLFEEEMANPVALPSAANIIAAHEARSAPDQPRPPPVDDGALWLWGRLKDFERLGLLARDPAEVCETMLDHMRESVRETAPAVAAWLKRMPA